MAHHKRRAVETGQHRLRFVLEKSVDGDAFAKGRAEGVVLVGSHAITGPNQSAGDGIRRATP